MSEEAKGNFDLFSFLSSPLKLSELVLAGTVLCYIAGFAITNLYFGSLGIVSFDVLRARYVLTGFSFAVFIALLVFMVYGLLVNLREYPADASAFRLLADVMIYSVERLLLVLLCVVLLVELSGFTSSPPSGIPSVSAPLSWSEWFSNAPADLLESTIREAGRALLIMFALALVLCAALLAINPRTSDGTGFRREYLKWIVSVRTLKTVVQIVVVTLVAYLAANAGVSLITFMMSNKVQVGLLGRQPSGTAGASGTAVTDAVPRLMLTILALYAIAAAFLLSMKYSARGEMVSKHSSREWRVASTYLGSVLIALLVGIYSLAVYPSLSQRIGGGRVVPVDVLTSNSEMAEWFEAGLTDVYLIDRGSKNSLFLVADTRSRRVVEVANSEIQAITYSVSRHGGGNRYP